MQAVLKVIGTAALMPCLAMCQLDRTPAKRDQAASIGSQPPLTAPLPAAPPAPSSPNGAFKMPRDIEERLAENDRAIADNQRMINELQAYSRSDSAKLDRLTAACRKTVSADMTRLGAKRIFDCIKSSW